MIINDEYHFDDKVISKYADKTTRTIRRYWKDFKQFNNEDDYSVRIVLAGHFNKFKNNDSFISLQN